MLHFAGEINWFLWLRRDRWRPVSTECGYWWIARAKWITTPDSITSQDSPLSIHLKEELARWRGEGGGYIDQNEEINQKAKHL